MADVVMRGVAGSGDIVVAGVSMAVMNGKVMTAGIVGHIVSAYVMRPGIMIGVVPSIVSACDVPAGIMVSQQTKEIHDGHAESENAERDVDGA